jgi:K(+)-stimulated pyrophosphate-energized sodium pump
VIGTFFARVGRGQNAIINALYKAVVVATLLSAVGFIPITLAYDDGPFSFWNLYGSALDRSRRDLPAGGDHSTTGTRWNPVKSIAEASQTGHATNIIAGLAIGMRATALPVITIAVGIIASFTPPASRCSASAWRSSLSSR